MYTAQAVLPWKTSEFLFFSVCDFEGTNMAWWLSWLERRPVTAEVVGSNPIRVVQKHWLCFGTYAAADVHFFYQSDF